ncbi:hypothetical protein ALC57_09571 [Trachymyrmex cornetzi]|uniref:Uncharacterized protein n=1 Tax=Trachymyrmex cornetzi TaxID=471704 RepID=A0A151J581_9HYME|nr:hypothetical protein ALC57_09571 [Trachymyrmex cornetzi]
MENLVHIVRNVPEEDPMDIADEVFDEEMNFEEIMDDDDDDEDVAALSDDNGYDSDQSEDQSEDVKSKIAYPEEVMALNEQIKQCAIYFYFTTGGSSILCLSCMTRLTDIEHMHKFRKHVIKRHAAIDGKYCSECRTPCFVIFSCDMCPICTH